MNATVSATLDPTLSLFQLLDQATLANPYPLYHRLRREDPVHWDPFLHAWVVTRYDDILTVLHKFSAQRTPTPERMSSMGLPELSPIAAIMVRQMLFMDAPAHTRLRGLATQAFTPGRLEALRSHIQDIVDSLLDRVLPEGEMDVMADFANVLPAIVTAEMLGVSPSDHQQLKNWSAEFAEILGNFQHNPDRTPHLLKNIEEMVAYFRSAIRQKRGRANSGLIQAFADAENHGDRLSEEEVIANCVITMVGGQETTTNWIGNGMLLLLQRPHELARSCADASLIPSAIEEFLRYESPTQHTTRTPAEDTMLGGKLIRKGQLVMAVLAAGNRDPERFPDPDRLDLQRTDNRHIAFGWGPHFCFGAPLARIEAGIAFSTMLRRLQNLTLKPVPLTWRHNLALRGLTALPVSFTASCKSKHIPEQRNAG